MDVTEFAAMMIIFLVVIAVAAMIMSTIDRSLEQEKKKFQEIYHRAGFSAFGGTLEQVGCYKDQNRYYYYFVADNLNFASLQDTRFNFVAVAEAPFAPRDAGRAIALGTVLDKTPLTDTLMFPDDQGVRVAFWFPNINAPPRAESVPLFISFWGDSDCVLNEVRQPGATFVKLSERCGAYYLYSAHTAAVFVRESTCRAAACPNYGEAECKASEVCYYDPGGPLGIGRGCNGCPNPARMNQCSDFSTDKKCTQCAGARTMCYWYPGGWFGRGSACRECPQEERCGAFIAQSQCQGCAYASTHCRWVRNACFPL